MRASRGPVAIFHLVPIRAIALVCLVLGGVTVLTMAPYELGTIRLAGVSLLWWYGIVVVPVVAVVATVVALTRAQPAPPPARPESSSPPSESSSSPA